MANLKKCLYCKKSFDIDIEEFAMPRTNRYAHLKCYEENFVPDDVYIEEIYYFLTSIKMKYDFIVCERQRNSYVKKLGYTNENILKALKYHYSVTNGDIVAAGGRIGIVPYVYDDALKYYNDLERKQAEFVKTYKTQQEQEKKEIIVDAPKKKIEKGYIDLSKI